ncbi:hypothetical protein LCGC14_0653540 [marine sediment metagenome]|uniref:Uncharacterized protein n=1 Tax=marine sediment metagenome TaxID=412755 RepID=A0A0F9RFK7_9ZZZZ
MKIYQSEDDGVIGEFLYQTVEFTQKEFADKGIGVISQVAVRQYLAEEQPDLKIKKLGSFKFDSQMNTVTVRIATINKIVPVALLNPGYDELKAKYDEAANELKAVYDALPDTISGNTPLSKLVAELMKKYNLSVDNFSILMGEKVRLQEKYDALVTAVSKDAQKFSDLLVENEKLKAATDSAFAECPHCVENKKLRAALQSAQTYYENDEYGNMGRIFEQTLKEDSADLGPDIGSKEIKDIADAMSKPPRIKPLGLNSAGEYLGLHGSD